MDFDKSYVRTIWRYWVLCAVLVGVSIIFDTGSRGVLPAWFPTWIISLAKSHGDAISFFSTWIGLSAVGIRSWVLFIQCSPNDEPSRDIGWFWIIFLVLTPLVFKGESIFEKSLQTNKNEISIAISAAAGVILAIDLFFLSKYKRPKKGLMEKNASALFEIALMFTLLGGICAVVGALLWQANGDNKLAQFSLMALSIQVLNTVIFIFFPNKYFN